MATVWAYREGMFPHNPRSGWSHSIHFDSLSSLVSGLEDAHLHGAVERLAVVAHGYPGKVHMDGNTAVSADDLSILEPYLKSNAMLIFVACNAGFEVAGNLFLTSVSRALPGRVIVAFSVWGYIDQWPTTPGNVPAAPAAKRPKPGTPDLTPWGSYAKWAYRGQIVRWPEEEQKKLPRRRCANPRCPGHSSQLHRCDWATDSTLRLYQP
jgi:hypothetical protein